MSYRARLKFSDCRSSRRALIGAVAETLEPRLLLAFGPAGLEFGVNTTTIGIQTAPATAMDADGDSVVVWNGNGPGDSDGIFAQRIASDGTKLGGEFRVNPIVAGIEHANPAVAMDADGDFVVAWASLRQAGQGQFDIHAQRYSASGTPIGSEFGVNTTFAQNVSTPSVAMDANGDFVIAWAAYGALSYDYEIYARRYSLTGAPLGGDFLVNKVTANNQDAPSVAMDADGDFVIAWQSFGQDSSSWGVYAQRYDAQGNPNKDPFKANSRTTGAQLLPSIAMSASGTFVIAWQSAAQDGSGYGIYAQRYASNGTPSGSETRINTTTSENQQNPSVGMDANGDYLIAWESYGQDKYGFGTYARRFSAAGVGASEFRVNKTVVENQLASSVAMDAAGDALIAWASFAQDGSSYGIYAQHYDESTDTAPPIVTEVTSTHGRITPGGRLAPIRDIVVSFSESLSTVGGAAGPNSVTNLANWALTRNGADVSSQISSISFGFDPATHKQQAVVHLAAFLSDANYELKLSQSLQDLAGNALDGDLNGVAGTDFLLQFSIVSIVRVGPEFPVNTTTTSFQGSPAIAADADGDFVVAWYGYGAGANGVLAQLYNAAGVPVGGEFAVNTYNNGRQSFPSVAMDPAGDFVVAWDSDYQDGSGFGVYAQRYSASGAPVGGEFRVNSSTVNNQEDSSIAMDDRGDFVVTWIDAATNDISARYFNSDGNPVSDDFRVNSFTPAHQFLPSVAMDSRGDFVITWVSEGQDGSDHGIYAQRYGAGGVPLGSEFRVNTFTVGDQNIPAVAMDRAGAFVITWSSVFQDLSWYGVYAQRYDASGNPLGAEFRVNSTTTDDQLRSEIAMDDAGDFVVAWDSLFQDGSQQGVYAQRYDAAGTAIGAEFPVNTYTNDAQLEPAVAMDSGGEFIITWESNQQDGSGPGIYAQRYAFNQPPTTVGIPNVTVNQDAPPSLILLFPRFSDSTDASSALSYSVIANTNPTLFGQVSINPVNGFLRLFFAAGQSGTATLTVRATDSSSMFVDTSFLVTVISTPDLIASAFIYQTAPHRLTFTFSQDVHASLNSNSVSVQRLAPNPAAITVSNPIWDSATNTATFNFTSILPDGDYRATLNGSTINAGGPAMSSNPFLNFYFLIGDLNHDRTISIADFITLASHFNQPGAYPDGDINYDGTVTIADFIQLASRFNTSLAAPSSLAPQAAASEAIVLKTRPRFSAKHRHHRHGPARQARGRVKLLDSGRLGFFG